MATTAHPRTLVPPAGGWPVPDAGEITVTTVTEPGDQNVALAVHEDGRHIGHVLTRPEYGAVVWKHSPGDSGLRPADWYGKGFEERSRAAAIGDLLLIDRTLGGRG